jgi:hypothetical protein
MESSGYICEEESKLDLLALDEDLLTWLQPKVSENDKQRTQLIQNARGVDGEVHEHFDCPICYQLLYLPQMCQVCLNIYCVTCSGLIESSSGVCPMCKSYF